jgi:hypothetical protein
MSYKQLNRDFATTIGLVRYGNGEDAGIHHKRSIERSMDWIVRNITAPAPAYRDAGDRRVGIVSASVSERRVYAAARHGVLVRSSAPAASVFKASGVYRIPIMMYTQYEDGMNWRWHCPLILRMSDDLHWKGLIERDKWQTFIRRLNSVCAEISVFAHAFRHGA